MHPTVAREYAVEKRRGYLCARLSGRIWKTKKRSGRQMNARDALFEDIQTLSDEAEELGLVDVSLVLEFAMDVYLKETGVMLPESPSSAGELLEKSAETLKARHKNNPSETTRLGYSMSVFPLSQVYRVAS